MSQEIPNPSLVTADNCTVEDICSYASELLRRYGKLDKALGRTSLRWNDEIFPHTELTSATLGQEIEIFTLSGATLEGRHVAYIFNSAMPIVQKVNDSGNTAHGLGYFDANITREAMYRLDTHPYPSPRLPRQSAESEREMRERIENLLSGEQRED